MALATFQDAPFEHLVDPTHGIVLGFAWGMDLGSFIEDHPFAQVVNEEEDIQEYVIPKSFGFCGLDTHVFLTFQMETLVGIALKWGLSGEDAPVDGACAGCLGNFLNRWFTAELEEIDNGYFQLAENTVKASLDLVDQQVVFEEVDQ